ncbi:hypothetical protein [Halobacillus karajensis]|uniref:hypothetical protein n=1 Tax=Halobacillus karajensis TaxID=195088 RepID=UPI00045CB470|nr:hypothetical protein [Halobacillus karajensis]CDQ21752.1 hypothetical protein BN982_04161 [Halobacillus karajensis]
MNLEEKYTELISELEEISSYLGMGTVFATEGRRRLEDIIKSLKERKESIIDES